MTLAPVTRLALPCIMSVEPLDPALYARPPILTLESGISLGRALVAACPEGVSEGIKKAATKLDAATHKAEAALAVRQRALGAISEEDSRLIDQAGDASWGALRMRLLGYAALPATEYPDSTRAAELVLILFGDEGLSFLKETYPVQWATADTILKRIDEDKLAADIDRVAGPQFLENIKKRHATYGAMVQRVLVKAQGADVDRGEEARALGSAIVSYATKLCAYAEPDEPEAMAVARAALTPIDKYREAQTKRNIFKNHTEAKP